MIEVKPSDAHEPIPDGATPAGEIGLCLSGGRYCVRLSRVGWLWRLMEAGKLLAMDRISTVSGTSITAGAPASPYPAMGV